MIRNALTAPAFSGAGLIGARAFGFINFNPAFHINLSP